MDITHKNNFLYCAPQGSNLGPCLSGINIRQMETIYKPKIGSKVSTFYGAYARLLIYISQTTNSAVRDANNNAFRSGQSI